MCGGQANRDYWKQFYFACDHRSLQKNWQDISLPSSSWKKKPPQWQELVLYSTFIMIWYTSEMVTLPNYKQNASLQAINSTSTEQIWYLWFSLFELVRVRHFRLKWGWSIFALKSTSKNGTEKIIRSYEGADYLTQVSAPEWPDKKW